MIKLLLILVVLYFVISTLIARRKNDKKRAEEHARYQELTRTTPEEERKNEAWRAYDANPCEETLQAYEDAIAADTKHWVTDFIMGIRYDTGIEGYPFDPERAQTWYAKARAKAEKFGDKEFIEDLNKFFTYYNRPYGNFKDLDIRSEHTRRIETCLVMCVSGIAGGGSGGIIACNIHNGYRGYVLRVADAISKIKEMPGHSPMILQLLEDYKAESEASSVLGLPAEECRQRYNSFLNTYVPDNSRLSERGMDYRFFIFALLVLTDKTPYWGKLRRFAEERGSVEKFYVKFFAWAIEGGSAEAVYMMLSNQEAFRRVYNWSNDSADYHLRNTFTDYVGGVGWTKTAQRMAEEFFPGTEKDDWLFD